MAKLTICCLFFAFTLWLVYAQIPSDCGQCDPSRCSKPVDCIAGKVKDRCDCCFECAKGVDKLCHHPAIRSSKFYGGVCGDNLECRLREGMPPGSEPEALCHCLIEGSLCGSNNKTYENLCQLMEDATLLKTRITVQNKGPCKSVPEIVTPPVSDKRPSGSNVSLHCEAAGFPIPTIEWSWTRVDGKTENLPNHDGHISITKRGGPDKWQVTGFLQIQNVLKEHEGDYACIAVNEYGTTSIKARLNIDKI